jgi:hypothetical protein
MRNRFSEVWQTVFIWGCNVTIGGLGAILCVLSLLEIVGLIDGQFAQKRIGHFFVEDLPVYSTLVGVMLIAGLAFVPPHSRRPNHVSIYFSIPFTVTLGSILLYQYLTVGSMPDLALVGFALLGIHGGIMRALPFAESAREWREST